MATEFATDVEMQSFDFSSFLRQATAARVVFPFISEQGPIGPVLGSVNSASLYGKSSSENMLAALKTAHSSGQHWYVRVPAADARFSACLVGIFNTGPDSKPFLGIAPLSAINDPDLSPVYQKGGLPLETSKFKIADAVEEGGNTMFWANGLVTSGPTPTPVATTLVDPLAIIYRNGTGDEGDEFSLTIISANAAPVPAVKTTTVIQGGNLQAGTYKYKRVPVTAKGEQEDAASEEVSVTITAADVTAGKRSIKLGWDIDDFSVRGLMIYRTFTPASGPTPERGSGRIAELQRTRLSVVDDTFNVPVVEAQGSTTRSTIEESFTLEVRKNGAVLENFSFSFNVETEDGTAAPIAESINNNSDYLRCIQLYTTKLVQSADGVICYSTPETKLAGGYNGAAKPTVDDLGRALEPFLNRDRYRVSAIVDLGWCSPAAAEQFALVEAAQRAHSLLSVPYYSQGAQAAVSYAASLTTGSRRSSIYTPWMKRRDTDTNSTRLIPPAAFACQVMLTSDLATTGGVGRSFAGLNRGVTDALGVEDPDKYEYSDDERDLMAVGLVNYFRRRPNAGMVLWEDWTLQRNLSAASFVSVSRLWDVIQNAISDYLEYKLKEPNDEFNTKEIKAGLDEYLNAQVLARNLGNFEVVVDSRAGNTNSTADQGIRNIDVYLTPVIPVRRYRCRTILTRQGANYEDLMQVI